ncbi:MAG: HEAT repeat domain-containing protein, partial [Candidatus Methanogasteraceae archaeon]
EMHDTRATPYLVRTLKDEDEQVRKNAAQSLGTIGDRRAAEYLARALEDESMDVRESAAAALDGMGWRPGDAAGRVQYLIGRKEWAKLEKIGGSAVAPLVCALVDEDWHIRKNVARVLGELSDPGAVEPLIRAMSDKSEEVREMVTLSLGKIGEPAVLPLIETLKARGQQAQDAAAEALGKIGGWRFSHLSGHWKTVTPWFAGMQQRLSGRQGTSAQSNRSL